MSDFVVYCSNALPARDRFDIWREMTFSGPGAVEVVHQDSRPFFGQVEWLPLGMIDAYRASYSAATYRRSRQLIKIDGFDGFSFHINLGGRSETRRHRERTVLEGFSATGYTFGNPFEVSLLPRAGSYNDNLNLLIPREVLLKKVPDAERRIGERYSRHEPLHLLVRYLELLRGMPSLAENTPVLDLAGSHVLDLLALLLGPNRDAEQEARQNGLRAARLAALLRYLKENHQQPGLSVTAAAHALKISERYLHKLLEGTGESFTDTMNRLRLERAQQMLGNPQYRHLGVSEIAFAAGFGDLSYFCRLFRRRFGDSPSGYRNGGMRNE